MKFDFEKFKEEYEKLPVPFLLMRKYGLSYFEYTYYRNIIEKKGVEL